jgi:hypothetical protein
VLIDRVDKTPHHPNSTRTTATIEIGSINTSTQFKFNQNKTTTTKQPRRRPPHAPGDRGARRAGPGADGADAQPDSAGVDMIVVCVCIGRWMEQFALIWI